MGGLLTEDLLLEFVGRRRITNEEAGETLTLMMSGRQRHGWHS